MVVFTMQFVKLFNTYELMRIAQKRRSWLINCKAVFRIKTVLEICCHSIVVMYENQSMY